MRRAALKPLLCFSVLEILTLVRNNLHIFPVRWLSLSVKLPKNTSFSYSFSQPILLSLIKVTSFGLCKQGAVYKHTKVAPACPSFSLCSVKFRNKTISYNSMYEKIMCTFRGRIHANVYPRKYTHTHTYCTSLPAFTLPVWMFQFISYS